MFITRQSKLAVSGKEDWATGVTTLTRKRGRKGVRIKLLPYTSFYLEVYGTK